MIKLTLNGQAVALFADTKIGITAMNPYFNEIGAFSFPFTIPYKPNEIILLHAARIQSTTTTKNLIWDAILEVDGIQLLIGEAVAEGDFTVRDGKFPILLRSAKTSFAKQAELLRMCDVDFGADTLSNPTDEQIINNYSNQNAVYPYSKYLCAPFYNNDAWPSESDYYKHPNYINQYDPVTGKVNISIETETESFTNVITYSFFVRFVIDQIFESLDMTIEDDDLGTITEMNRWFMLSLCQTNWQNPYKYSFSQSSVRDFLTLLRQFGIAVIVNERTNSVSLKFVKDLFSSTSINPLFAGDGSSETIVFSFPADGYKISYKDATDDLIVQAVASNIIEVENFAALPSPSVYYSDFNLMYRCISTGNYYVSILQSKEAETDPNVFKWESIGAYRQYISGNGEKPIEIGAAVLRQRLETRTITKTVTYLGETITQTWDIDIEMPEINTNMNEALLLGLRGKYIDLPYIFLFNWGVKTHYAPDPRVYATYPLTSGDCFRRDETSEGNLSMRTNGEKSIIQQLVKPEQDWLLTRKQKRQYFRISILDYANFVWSDTYPVANVNYLVNSLIFDITQNGISLVEAELYTIT